MTISFLSGGEPGVGKERSVDDVNNPLPVAIISGGGGGGGGTTTKANAAPPTQVEGTTNNPLSTNLSGELRVVPESGGNAVTISAGGAMKVDGSAATQPVSAASLPLPTGAATSAKQPALGTAGAASADVLTVQGVASMTALKVDGSAVTQPVSGNVGITGAIPTGANTIGAVTQASGPWTENLTQVNSVAVLTGAGATGTGSQRITVAQDSTTVAGSASIPTGTNVVGKVGIDQTTPGTTNNVVTDGVTDNVQFSGSVSSAATLVTLNTQGFATLTLQFTSVGSGNTITVESSNDGTPGTGTTFITASVVSVAAPVTTPLGAFTPSSSVVYLVPVAGPTMRVRVSTYGSGTISLSGVSKRAPITSVALATSVLSNSTVTGQSNNLITPAVRNFNFCYNGTTWDGQTTIVGASTAGTGVAATALTPTTSANAAVVPTVTSAVASNLVAKASAGNGYRYAITTGASAGYLMVFNATSAPADGTVTPTIVRAIAANTSLEVDHSGCPDRFSTGCTLVFSTTGPYTKTASATAALEASVV